MKELAIALSEIAKAIRYFADYGPGGRYRQ